MLLWAYWFIIMKTYSVWLIYDIGHVWCNLKAQNSKQNGEGSFFLGRSSYSWAVLCPVDGSFSMDLTHLEFLLQIPINVPVLTLPCWFEAFELVCWWLPAPLLKVPGVKLCHVFVIIPFLLQLDSQRENWWELNSGVDQLYVWSSWHQLPLQLWTKNPEESCSHRPHPRCCCVVARGIRGKRGDCLIGMLRSLRMVVWPY